MIRDPKLIDPKLAPAIEHQVTTANDGTFVLENLEATPTTVFAPAWWKARRRPIMPSPPRAEPRPVSQADKVTSSASSLKDSKISQA